jgi:hypothetical protein
MPSEMQISACSGVRHDAFAGAELSVSESRNRELFRRSANAKQIIATPSNMKEEDLSMPTTLPSGTYRSSGASSSLARRLLAVYGISVVAVCGLLVVNGPQIRAAAEAEEARVVAEETKAFCSKFGIGPETSRYAQCAAELTEIRALHLARNVGESIF